uniref:Uncharacterized protein n=1 Tax=Arundo donax TaxID=35708 RepID=A0A0A9ASY5_ARUDO
MLLLDRSYLYLFRFKRILMLLL